MTGKTDKKFFIVTGMSGAGKSQALKCFEDLGFFCVDNLPVALVPNFADMAKKRHDMGDIAIGIDIRERRALPQLPAILEGLRSQGVDSRIIFFDASDNVLVQRFSETRHRHPLGKNLSSAIREERAVLADIKAMAHKKIDSSAMTLGELKEVISQLLALKKSREMKLTVVSFGYKYGLPMDADLVMDVRFLSNPNYVEGLKDKTGLDKPVADYVIADKRTKPFLRKFTDLVSYLIPSYMKEGKSYLTIAIGCTGGKHRSVFVAHTLAEALRKDGLNVSEFHKDIRRK